PSDSAVTQLHRKNNPLCPRHQCFAPYKVISQQTLHRFSSWPTLHQGWPRFGLCTGPWKPEVID
ncbi:hypothetical protein NDU88_003419, partial [Pleurodeles waltl]